MKTERVGHDPATGCAYLLMAGFAIAIVLAFVLGFVLRGLV